MVVLSTVLGDAISGEDAEKVFEESICRHLDTYLTSEEQVTITKVLETVLNEVFEVNSPKDPSSKRRSTKRLNFKRSTINAEDNGRFSISSATEFPLLAASLRKSRNSLLATEAGGKRENSLEV